MAGTKPAMKGTQKSAKSTSASRRAVTGFTDEEKAAMRERFQELQSGARPRPGADKADGEGAILEKIAPIKVPDGAMAEKLHAIVRTTAPALSPILSSGVLASAKPCKVGFFVQSA